MARIVITTYGTAGDINPYIALGIGLRTRGHGVVFAVEEGLRASVESAGFPLHLLSGDMMAVLGDQMRAQAGSTNPLKALRLIVHEYLVPTLRPRVDELMAAGDGADLLIASAPQVAAAFAADLLSLPLVTIAPSPAGIPSAAIAPQPLPFRLPEPVQHALNRATWALGEQVTARIVDPPLNSACASYGLTPRRNWIAIGGRASTAQLVAVAVSPALCPAPPDWPAVVRETGFLFWDRPTDWRMPQEIETFLAEPGPIIAISSGSMSLEMGHVFAAFYRDSIAATHAVGARALVIGAPHEALPGPLPPKVCAVPFAPFSEIYPRCAAVIHHGGIGTAAQALRAGVPQVVVPWALDQFWTGAQVERIGAGRTAQARRYTAAKATELLRGVLQSARYRQTCAALAARLASEDGVATLCDAIRDVLTSGKLHVGAGGAPTTTDTGT